MEKSGSAMCSPLHRGQRLGALILSLFLNRKPQLRHTGGSITSRLLFELRERAMCGKCLKISASERRSSRERSREVMVPLSNFSMICWRMLGKRSLSISPQLLEVSASKQGWHRSFPWAMRAAISITGSPQA